MSRIRSIHPGLWTDETFVSLSSFARLLFVGMWNECDDKGTFPWSPLQMKMRILPADNVDAVALMDELEAADCIRSYEVGGKRFGAVRNFAKFQRPKKPNDIHPATAEILAFAGHNAEPVANPDDAVPNQLPTGREKPPQMEEGKKEEVTPPAPRKRGEGGKHLLPKDWKLPTVAELPPEARACAEQWTDASYKTHGEAFTNYWRGAGRMMADWRMTWANRIVDIHDKVMRAQKFGNDPPGAGSNKPVSPDAGKLLARYEAGEITFDEFMRLKAAPAVERKQATGPPRSIGQIAAAVAKQAANH